MAEGRMNLAALQQRDPYISEIVDTASQVALYSFNSKASEWEKTSIEGSLFIYKRSASPLNGFMILNRLGLNNLIEPISRDLEFQLSDPFLLYKTAKSIFGVWFYDKDECKRIGTRLDKQVQDLKKASPSPGQGAVGQAVKVTTGPTVKPEMTFIQKGAGAGAPVDIMQMLSKAQEEYDTSSTVVGAPGAPGQKKTEPKPMIDNPNAAATKKSNLIRPMPLKMPDSDTLAQEPDEGELSTTPGAITLETLFRTASLQQGQKPAALQRSTSVSSGTQAKSVDYKMELEKKHKSVAADELPPLLRHIMSSGSMVEDIERQHIQRGDDAGGTTIIPDVSQPPPNHPAYRGPSPQARPCRRSPRQQHVSESAARPGIRTSQSELSLEKGSAGGAVAPQLSPQILSSNLLPQFPAVSSSQLFGQSAPSQSSGDVPRLSPEVSKSQTSPRSTDRSEAVTVVKPSEPLLTPADLLAPSFPSSSSSSTLHTVTSKGPDMVVNPSLATAAASLITSTELLSPFAFLSSSSTASSRKTPPAITTEGVGEDRSSEVRRDEQRLPVAALTREQLQQALLYLVKNDNNFITTIHEAYLKSLHELSGSKS